MEKFDDLIEYDPVTSKKRKISKKVQPAYIGQAIQGSFSELGKHLVFLFRIDETLHLVIDNEHIVLDNNIRIIRVSDKSDETITFMIIDIFSNETIIEIKYQKPNIYPALEFDPTPFVDEEDFDYGLFLSNVLNDVDRRNRVYR